SDAPVPTMNSELEPKKDEAAAAELLKRYELFRLYDRVFAGRVPEPSAAAAPVDEVEIVSGAPETLEELKELVFVYDDGGFYVLSGGKIHVYYNSLFSVSQARSALEDPGVKKTVLDFKALWGDAALHGVTPAGDIFDVRLACYVADPFLKKLDANSLSALCRVPVPSLRSDFAPTDNPLFPLLALLPAAEKYLTAELEKNDQTYLLKNIETPLARVLAEMEERGFAVDSEGIAAYGDELDAKAESLRREIVELAGEDFNVNSPKQLGDILFGKLGLKGGKKTKTGYSTNADILEKLAPENPIVGAVLDYRTFAKLKSTYCDGLLKCVGADGRIRTTFNQTETRTGRLSSSEPNLQNIPVRTAEGARFRKYFIAPEGSLLVDADYSQIELRVLAHIADDKNMIAAFTGGTDIHTQTASQIFGVPVELVNPQMRRRAKAVNFGIVYGIGPFSLANDIHTSVYEAKRYIDAYLAHYDGVAAYMDACVSDARANGYVETLFHRRRRLPELNDSKASVRAFGERVARNTPIQGTAADIIKLAMIRVEDRLKGMDARLIIQVHDELIVECPGDEAEEVAAILKEEMENVVDLKVPLTVEAHIGRTWYDAKG
nr:DNA polymerase I [Clostridia bacterium]